jgi:hypothetical protein
MTTSELINEVAAACAKAQLELRPAVKDAVNPAFRSKYADLHSVMEAAKVYAKHGIAVWQDATTEERGVAVRTRLAHTSGQWVEMGPMIVPVGKQDAHGYGSATTYAKRYALSAALGISTEEDDDGNAASVPVREEPKFKPVGYDDNLLTLESLSVPEARAAFKEWAPEMRAYFTQVDPRYAAFKAKGEAFDAEQRKKTKAA